MSSRSLFSSLARLTLSFAFAWMALLGLASNAHADDATAFVHAQHDQLKSLLRQPPSADRDTRVAGALSQMVDYDEMTRRAFGQPCPNELPGCKNHWADLTDAQKVEVGGLLRRLVEKSYRKNLSKTLDYDVAYPASGTPSGANGDTSVHTEATSKSKPRDPAVLVDYIVRGVSGSMRVVDVITEGSSLTKNYYDQFHRMLTNPDQGYAYVVKKLNDKIAQPD